MHEARITILCAKWHLMQTLGVTLELSRECFFRWYQPWLHNVLEDLQNTAKWDILLSTNHSIPVTFSDYVSKPKSATQHKVFPSESKTGEKKKKARQHKHHHECTRVDNVSELFKRCGWSRFAPKLRPCTSAMHRVKVVWPDQLILRILLPGVIRNAGIAHPVEEVLLTGSTWMWAPGCIRTWP